MAWARGRGLGVEGLGFASASVREKKGLGLGWQNPRPYKQALKAKGDPEIICHPTVVFQADLLWTRLCCLPWALTKLLHAI